MSLRSGAALDVSAPLDSIEKICELHGVDVERYPRADRAGMFSEYAHVAIFAQEGALVLKDALHHDHTVSWRYSADGQVTRLESVDDQQFKDAECLCFSMASDMRRDQPRPSRFSSWLKSECWSLRSVFRDVLAASVLLNIFALAMPLFIMNVYDRVVPNQAYETLWALTSGIVLVIVFEVLIRYLRHHFIELGGRRIDRTLSSRLFHHVLDTEPAQMPRSVGAAVSEFREFESIRHFLGSASITALIDVPFALFFLFIIYLLGGTVAVIPAVSAVMILLLGMLMHFPLKRAVEDSQRAMSERNVALVESLSTLETLKAFNAEMRASERFRGSVDSLSWSALRVRKLADSLSLISGSLVQLSIVGLVLYGVYLIAEQNMSLGALVACVLLNARVLMPMVQAANLAAQYFQTRSAIEGLNRLTSTDREQDGGQRYLSLQAPKGAFRIENVSHRYGNHVQALKDINLEIKPGERLALIGTIGSGKSTLLKMFAGMLKPETGLITIDGLDLKQINPAEYRSHLAYVPQEVDLVSGTLRDNVCLKDAQATDEAVIESLSAAGLERFVQLHPQGLNMPISEQSRGLSGGQRQGVAIARALLAQPDIFIFDELTSAMDNQTESQVIRSVERLSRDKTLILSTHRTSLLNLVDRIVVLNAGQVVADGPKQQVLEALKKGLIAGARV